MKEIIATKPSRFSEGHRMCAGCGAPVVARHILRALKAPKGLLIAMQQISGDIEDYAFYNHKNE